MSLKLLGYWRSGAAWRVRIALELKGLQYAQTAVDLRHGEQNSAGYLAINPQGLVPTLDVDGVAINQSIAILEWLEETHPLPSLLPSDPIDRARVRAMTALVACDIHPLNNLRVLHSLRHDLGADEIAVAAWIARWIDAGFQALEQMIERHGGAFAFGDHPTFADCCLVPQVYSARRFGVDMSPFPLIGKVDSQCGTLAPFIAADARNQPDADA
jgi:maleylpyruvate isomerase